MAFLKSIESLTLKEMFEPEYSGLSEGLSQLPLPEYFLINKWKLPIPHNLDEFTDNICYGQRLFLVTKEDNDIGLILRVIDGYYYPLLTKKTWDEEKALTFGKKVITLKVVNLYPVAMCLINFIAEMIEREQRLLHREPSKIEKAAGIDKLNIFSELTTLDFLRDSLKKTTEEVMLTPYNECLVRFMLAKEIGSYQERYFDLMRKESEPKNKYHG
jgi:hypothetical protein